MQHSRKHSLLLSMFVCDRNFFHISFVCSIVRKFKMDWSLLYLAIPGKGSGCCLVCTQIVWIHIQPANVSRKYETFVALFPIGIAGIYAETRVHKSIFRYIKIIKYMNGRHSKYFPINKSLVANWQ